MILTAFLFIIFPGIHCKCKRNNPDFFKKYFIVKGLLNKSVLIVIIDFQRILPGEIVFLTRAGCSDFE